MWLLAVSVPLLPALVMLSRRYRVKVGQLCRRALAFVRRLVPRRVCVSSTHAFVFTECTHGKADSVLEAFDLYAETHPSMCVGPNVGEALDEVVKRVRPSSVLELGTHCGYSSVRLLRLLPPAGCLLTVERDPLTAELGEEILLFQVLTSSSHEAIPTLHPLLERHCTTSDGFDLVLMDHDEHQYLPDLLALEREDLLCRSGCSVVVIIRSPENDRFKELIEYIRSKPDWYCIKTQLHGLMEIFFQEKTRGGITD